MDALSHYPELMMSIVAGASAIMGLTGVVIGQVIRSDIPKIGKGFYGGALIVSVVLGILAVTSAIGWLTSESDMSRVNAVLYFSGQLITFSASVFGYWIGMLWKSKNGG
jgi:hypothetical protein